MKKKQSNYYQSAVIWQNGCSLPQLFLFMGALSAFFLKSLTYVTDVRLANPWLLFILPISGVVLRISIRVLGKMLAEEIT